MLLTLQNGLGNDEFLAKHFGAERVLGGLCFIALNRISATEIERYAYGHIILGEFGRDPQARTDQVAAEFNRSAVTCTITDDLALERWGKLIWNIPFNGLSILAGGIDTLSIIANKGLRQATLALMDEVIAAANKCGHALPNDAWREHMQRTQNMGDYKPSTLLDWEAGRPLEIEPIWGEPSTEWQRRQPLATATAWPRRAISESAPATSFGGIRPFFCSAIHASNSTCGITSTSPRIIEWSWPQNSAQKTW